MFSRDKTWNLLIVRLARDAEDLTVSVLFDLGATGTVTLEETPDALKLGVYFHAAVSSGTILSELRERLEKAGLLDSLQSTEFDQVPDQDWLRKWKEGFEALEIGDKLLIAPSWKIHELLAEDAAAGLQEGSDLYDRPRSLRGRLLIQIDPGMAFGTGTHETTRLCLEALERLWKGGSLLDVGTGTGILAMAAALLVPGSNIVAIDVDPVAVEIARQNIVMNRLAGVRVVEGQPAGYASGEFDVVVANLTANVITDILGSLAAAVKPSGRLILSGILTGQAAEVAVALEGKGFRRLETTIAGEWVCLAAMAS
ncbi:MAG TPA: 50S ribosomal protein L11 methyltransferase [Blastocatellia bacterium]|nr:50S ribosomal protein L11 methyltransferase [Blastocatellia bacterium]